MSASPPEDDDNSWANFFQCQNVEGRSWRRDGFRGSNINEGRRMMPWSQRVQRIWLKHLWGGESNLPKAKALRIASVLLNRPPHICMHVHESVYVCCCKWMQRLSVRIGGREWKTYPRQSGYVGWDLVIMPSLTLPFCKSCRDSSRRPVGNNFLCLLLHQHHAVWPESTNMKVISDSLNRNVTKLCFSDLGRKEEKKRE